MINKPPKSLANHLREGRCVLFAGSGLSAWAKLPTWMELLKFLVEKLEEEEPGMPNKGELDGLLQAGKLLDVADYCKEKLGERLYNEVLSDQLRGDKVDIPEPHKMIVQLPFAGVVTTNYDKLLERAYNDVPRTPTHRDIDMLGPLLFNNKFFILKAYGDIDHSDSLILTTRDYREIIHSNPGFNALFSAILLTKSILFIGYSMGDPDFRLLLDRQLTNFKGNMPERYSLMRGIGEIERDVLWRAARIRVIPYDEHNDILTFLQYLQDEVVRSSMTRLAPEV
jgi:hypothetical protein